MTDAWMEYVGVVVVLAALGAGLLAALGAGKSAGVVVCLLLIAAVCYFCWPLVLVLVLASMGKPFDKNACRPGS